MHLKSN